MASGGCRPAKPACIPQKLIHIVIARVHSNSLSIMRE